VERLVQRSQWCAGWQRYMPEGFAARTIAFVGETAALDGGNEPCYGIPRERERERERRREGNIGERERVRSARCARTHALSTPQIVSGISSMCCERGDMI